MKAALIFLLYFSGALAIIVLSLLVRVHALEELCK